MSRLLAVAAVFINDDGDVLFGLRPKEQTWALFGGKVEGSESPSQALVREIREELGFDLEQHTAKYPDAVQPLIFIECKRKSDGLEYTMLYFTVLTHDELIEVKVDPDSAAATTWSDPDLLPGPLSDHDREAVQLALHIEL